MPGRFRLPLCRYVGRSLWTAPDARVRHWPDQGAGPKAGGLPHKIRRH